MNKPQPNIEPEMVNSWEQLKNTSDEKPLESGLEGI